MKAYGYLYIGSLITLLIGERLFSGSTGLRYTFSIASVVFIIVAIYLAFKNKHSALENQLKAYQYPILLLALGLFGHLIYGLSTDAGLSLFGQEPEAEHQLKIIFQAAAILFWGCTAP